MPAERRTFPLPANLDGETLREELAAAGVPGAALEVDDAELAVTADLTAAAWSTLASTVGAHRGQSPAVRDRVAERGKRTPEGLAARVKELEDAVAKLVLRELTRP